MSRTDRDLVLALRAELAAIDPSRACDRRAEALALRGHHPAAMGVAGAATSDAATALGLGRGRRRDAPFARLLVRLGPELTAALSATSPADTRGGSQSATGFDWDAAADHCRTAWLRGLFLAHGSLSLSGGRTHLEFVLPPRDAPELARRLASIDLPASWRIRRRRGVVTWKSGETVEVFLRRIGATGALLEIEARQVSRALRGDLNRVLNAESANLQRAVGASGRQVAAIEELITTGELSDQPYVVRLVAAARRETPEATLAELAERLELHRSAVQRALERIERLANAPDDRRSRRADRPAGGSRHLRGEGSGSPSSMPLA